MNCHAMRYEALQKSNRGIVGHYIPTCDAKGHFMAIQSHGSTGQSWCVDPKTGDRHEKSLTQFGQPDCSIYMKGKVYILFTLRHYPRFQFLEKCNSLPSVNWYSVWSLLFFHFFTFCESCHGDAATSMYRRLLGNM